MCYLEGGDEARLEGDWQTVGRRALPLRWAGSTEFEEDVALPLELPTLFGNHVDALSLPHKPAPPERELHNLTHAPYQTWRRAICVTASDRSGPHEQGNAAARGSYRLQSRKHAHGATTYCLGCL